MTSQLTARDARIAMIEGMGAAVPAHIMREDRATTREQRYDFFDIAKAITDADGFVRDSPIVGRTGVFNYPQPDGTTRREYRPADEVFHVDALASLRGVPVTIGHAGRVTADANAHAIIGTVLTEGRRDGDNVVADIVIHTPKRMGALRDLSLGYRVDLDLTPGRTPDGQDYDAVQRNIRVNHLAVVEKGRAGNARVRLDAGAAADARRKMINAMHVESRNV